MEGISESIDFLQNYVGDIKVTCMVASGYHFHFIVSCSKEEIIGIVFVEQRKKSGSDHNTC